MSPSRLATLQRYLAALACVALAAAVRWCLTPLLGARYPYLLQFLTVLATARLFGFGPAMLCLFAGSSPLIFGIEFIAPQPFGSGLAFWMRMAIIYGLGTLLIWNFDRQRRFAGLVEDSKRLAFERLEQLDIEIGQREREQRLSAQLRAVVESSDDAIISKGLDGLIHSWNYGAEQIYGYSAEEAIGKDLNMLVSPERLYEEADMMERIRHGGRVRHFETVRLRKDGSPIHVSLTMSPIQDSNGELVGISHISREITQRKQLEEQLRQTQKLESLGVLAGGLAHDFNNLLTGIMGNAGLAISEPGLPEATRTHLERVLAASERAALLVRQMLAYAGKGHFVVAPLDVSVQVSEIVSLIRTSLPENLNLDLQLASGLPPVESDRAQLQQVIMNLCLNGAEAIGKENGTLTITTMGRQTESEQQVILQVRDTGCGMDEATRARIFDPFFTTKFTGRGLGLSAVIGIIRAHHGFISVESELGRGSTFTVVLPAARTDNEIEPRGYGHVLVACSEALDRDMTRFTLERRGYTVETAPDSETALEKFAAGPNGFDAVLLDLSTDEADTEETLLRLQSLRPGVRVILSSTLTESEARRQLGHTGVAALLQRPSTASVLASKVKQALRRNASAPQ